MCCYAQLNVGICKWEPFFQEDDVRNKDGFLGLSELGLTFSSSRHSQGEPGANAVIIHCPWSKGALKNCHLLLSLSAVSTLFYEGWCVSQVLPGALQELGSSLETLWWPHE